MAQSRTAQTKSRTDRVAFVACTPTRIKLYSKYSKEKSCWRVGSGGNEYETVDCGVKGSNDTVLLIVASANAIHWLLDSETGMDTG